MITKLNHSDDLRFSRKFLLEKYFEKPANTLLPKIPQKTIIQKVTKSNKKTYIQQIPEKVNDIFPEIVELLKAEIEGFTEEKLREVISIVACHVRRDKDNNNIETPIKAEYIRKYVPRGDKYLKGLIDLGIIQRSGNYKINVICYKYCFAPQYVSKYISFPIKDMHLIRRLENAQLTFKKKAAKSVRNHSEQTIYLNQLTIQDSFIDFIESHFKENIDKYNYAIGSANRIWNGDIFYSVDNTSGRFHSNITNMPKELRQFLRIKNEPLVNIDIKNSQPYLSTIILTNPSKVSWLTQNPDFQQLLQTLKVSQNEDVKKYISLVVMGEIYEFLKTEFLKNNIILTRDETKKQVLRILFAKNRMPKDETNKKCRQTFIDNFKTVHKIFSKVRGKGKGNKYRNYKRFAILLQRIESYLMLDIILKRIYKELPGTIAVTVHDSIMTGILTNNVEAIKKIMEEELTFFVGFSPKIKIEERIKEKREKERKEKEIMQYGAGTFVCVN